LVRVCTVAKVDSTGLVVHRSAPPLATSCASPRSPAFLATV
jgi:hypothetical protein